jgi:hypothetical protein
LRLRAAAVGYGQLLAVTPRGAIRQVIDVSASQGHIVPTSVAERNGVFYVGNLNLFPIDPQWARVQAIAKGDADDDFGFAPGFSPGRGYHIVSSKMRPRMKKYAGARLSRFTGCSAR